MKSAPLERLRAIRARAAQLNDVDAIVALERATESAAHWSRATYAQMVQRDNSAGRRCLWIAEYPEIESAANATHLLGYAVAALQSGSAELESVAVAAAVRREGVGGTLCKAAITWCTEHGAKEMTLEVRAANATAIGLYKRLGFVETARRPGYYRDPEDDAVMMRLLLL